MEMMKCAGNVLLFFVLCDITLSDSLTSDSFDLVAITSTGSDACASSLVEKSIKTAAEVVKTLRENSL